MVKYTIQTSKQKIVGFQVTGHTGYKEAGQDIVCAGVSAIAQTAALGLVNHLGQQTRWHQETGKLSCQISNLQSDEEVIASQAILRSMQLGIEAICEAYPDFVKVDYKEV
ncbi:MAG: ribosomal-processing cysteine protease Prp [Methylocystaceae bacterium]